MRCLGPSLRVLQLQERRGGAPAPGSAAAALVGVQRLVLEDEASEAETEEEAAELRAAAADAASAAAGAAAGAAPPRLVGSFELTPPPETLASSDAIASARVRLEMVADRLGLSGAAEVTAYVQAQVRGRASREAGLVRGAARCPPNPCGWGEDAVPLSRHATPPRALTRPPLPAPPTCRRARWWCLTWTPCQTSPLGRPSSGRCAVQQQGEGQGEGKGQQQGQQQQQQEQGQQQQQQEQQQRQEQGSSSSNNKSRGSRGRDWGRSCHATYVDGAWSAARAV